MNLTKIRFGRTLFLRLMFTYLPMVVLSLLLTTILIAYTTGRYMKKAMDALYSNTIQSMADILDSKLSNVYNTMFQLACSRMINDLRTAPEPYSIDDLYMISDIVDELSAATICDNMIRKIYIYSPKRDYILAGRAKHGCDYFLRENYPNCSPNEITEKIINTYQSCMFSVPNEQASILTLVTYIPLISGHPDLYICAILNEQELHSVAIPSLDDKENLVFLNSDNEIIYNYKPDYMGSLLWDGRISSLIDQTGALAYTIQSERTGLTYVYLNQSSFVREQLTRITLTALIIGFMTIIAVIISVIIASKRISVPVNSLITLFGNRERASEKLSDLDLIKEKVSKMYQDQSEMNRRIAAVSTTAIERSLERIFNKNSMPEQEAIILDELHLSFPHANAGICILKIMHYIILKHKFSEASFVDLKHNLGAILQDQLKPYCDSFIVYRENMLIVSLNFAISPEVFQELLQEQLYAVQKIIKKTFSLDIHVVISDMVGVKTDANVIMLNAFHLSFMRAQYNLEQLFFTNEPVIILGSSVNETADLCIYQYPGESETVLINLLFSGQGPKAVEFMENIVLFNRDQCGYANMKQLLYELLAAPIKALLKAGSNPDEILRPRNALLADLEACDTVDDAVAYIASIYQQASLYLKTIDTKWPMQRKDVLLYIEENYMRDIGVADISGFFNLSQGYFSRIFRQMMNESFVEYLTRYRVKKAEKLILEKHIPLKDVAVHTGFNSYKSFYRAFKNQTLCNPHEFKQKMLGVDQTEQQQSV